MSYDINDLKPLLTKVADGDTLSEDESETAFDMIMSGNATPAQIGAFLMALRLRGETVDEITGAARAMRAKAQKIEAPENAMDIVGTGGDGTGTLNISTASAIVVAGCGVPVAKHGNRALSSKTGAADVLTELGINIEANFELVRESIWANNLGFLMAPRHHSAMRNVAGPRIEMGTRTIFNLLGPLSNPSLVTRQMTGVFAPEWTEPIAQVLGNLGLTRAWVVHGSDGTDELTTTGPSRVSELKDGKVTTYEVNPEDANLPHGTLEDIKGGDAAHNAAAVHQLLAGKKSAYRNAVLMTAAGSLMIADKVDNLLDGAKIAGEAIDSGAARDCLARLVEITNRGA
ncbi:MAG: anthranilate phosphoribosyltransferase [Alphaproteobacteria bacterium]|nr:anthranilate phosphoribosyltransferase [Alphaproteobacteria bacterium]HCP01196.1 anthranilate phosphoribosyltransferase [Rhodospirillaceae bacterium]